MKSPADSDPANENLTANEVHTVKLLSAPEWNNSCQCINEDLRVPTCRYFDSSGKIKDVTHNVNDSFFFLPLSVPVIHAGVPVCTIGELWN